MSTSTTPTTINCVNCRKTVSNDSRGRKSALVSLNSPIPPGTFTQSGGKTAPGALSPVPVTYAKALTVIFDLPLPEPESQDEESLLSSYLLCRGCDRGIKSLLKWYDELTTLSLITGAGQPQSEDHGLPKDWFQILRDRAGILRTQMSEAEETVELDIEIDVKPDLGSFILPDFTFLDPPEAEAEDDDPADPTTPLLTVHKYEDGDPAVLPQEPVTESIPVKKQKLSIQEPQIQIDPKTEGSSSRSNFQEKIPVQVHVPALSYEHKCPTCSKSICGGDKQFLRHLALAHNQTGFSVCNWCKALYPSNSLYSHLQVHVGEPGVLTCNHDSCAPGKVFNSQRHLNGHIARMHVEGSSTSSRTKILEPQKSSIEDIPVPEISLFYHVHQCPNCSESICGDNKFRRHLAQAHNQTGVSICKWCKILCSSKGILHTHIQSHANEPRVPTCNQDSCSPPGRVFSDPSKLREHISKFHSGTPAVRYPCPTCGLEFVSKSNLQNHELRLHFTGPKDEERPFICDQCGSRYQLEQDLRNHQKIHLPDEFKIKCPIDRCNYRAVNQNQIQVHISYVHTPEANFKCSYPNCTKAFKADISLQNHVKCEHENPKSWICCYSSATKVPAGAGDGSGTVGIDCGNRRFNFRCSLIHHLAKAHSLGRQGAHAFFAKNREMCKTNEPYLKANSKKRVNLKPSRKRRKKNE